MSVCDSRLLRLCDGKLQTEDGYTFGIHRYMLAKKSQYFCSMFCGINEDRKVFGLPGIRGSCLSEILLYIYTDRIFVTEQNLAELLEAADYLLMKNLNLQIRQSFMKCITITNCLEVLNTAHLIKDEHIFQKCFRFIETKYEEIIQTQLNDLTELPLELLEEILRSRSLKVRSETTVWLSIVAWLQRNDSMRLHCFPQLAMTLAGQDLDEELATEILLHEIVSKHFMKELGEIEDSHDFSSNLEAVLYVLRNGSSTSKNPDWSRIPSHVHVITLRVGNGDIPKYDVYITYDENLDFWSKLGEIRGFLIKNLIVVGHKLFLFDYDTCRQFDMLSQVWIPMSMLRNAFFIANVLGIGGNLYVFGEFLSKGENLTWESGMEVYDIEQNRWSNSVLLSNIEWGAFVTIDNKIFAVGYTQNRVRMTTQMFEPATQQWTSLSPPNVRKGGFALLAHRGKAYMIGGYNDRENVNTVEVFDPETNAWRDLPLLPNSYFNYLAAFVLNDQIFVSCSVSNDKRDIFRLNESEERWEGLAATDSFKSFADRHFFSTVYDENAIRNITKQTRNPKANLQRSPFFY